MHYKAISGPINAHKSTYKWAYKGGIPNQNPEPRADDVNLLYIQLYLNFLHFIALVSTAAEQCFILLTVC